MKVLVLGLLGLVLVTGLAVALLSNLDRSARVYSVVELRAGLARHPDAWLRRTLQVRGVAVPCGEPQAETTAPCPTRRAVLRGETGVGGDLLLEWGQPDPLLGPLRGIPLLGSLLPAPATVHWGVPATYVVEIETLPADRPSTMASYDYAAVLLDATP